MKLPQLAKSVVHSAQALIVPSTMFELLAHTVGSNDANSHVVAACDEPLATCVGGKITPFHDEPETTIVTAHVIVNDHVRSSVELPSSDTVTVVQLRLTEPQLDIVFPVSDVEPVVVTVPHPRVIGLLAV